MPRTRKYQTNGERQAAYRRRCAEQRDIAPIPSALGQRRWKAMLKAAVSLLDRAAGEMQDYFEEHSEQWQDSPAGQSIAEMMESAEDALASLDDIPSQTRQFKPVIT